MAYLSPYAEIGITIQKRLKLLYPDEYPSVDKE